jgi:hypothetical protein
MRLSAIFPTTILFLAFGYGQTLQLNLDKLAPKAVETVDVTLDGAMLQLASRFLSGKQPDEAKAKKLIAGLKGVYVKSFEFAKEGEYSPEDLEAIRAQLRAPAWSRIVGVRSKRQGENVEVFVKTEANQIAGLVVLSAEPKELTVVQIDGPIDPDQLSELGGHFGIPKVELERRKQPKATPK